MADKKNAGVQTVLHQWPYWVGWVATYYKPSDLPHIYKANSNPKVIYDKK